MKKNYLVIESFAFDKEGNKHQFTHFIDLKDDLLSDVKSLFHHITYFCGKDGQQVEKVYFSEDRMTNW